MKRYCLALDLKNDPDIISGYRQIHQRVSAEIKSSITDAGISVMDIYLTGNRLFMIMETGDDFDFNRKDAMDTDNPAVQVWEKLMWEYQQPLPHAKAGEKWVIMEQIFTL